RAVSAVQSIQTIQTTPVIPPGPAVTRTSALLGSPRYMAPEQLRSPRDVDVRADVWALGAILFELVAGKPAFGGETLEEIRADHRRSHESDCAGIRGGGSRKGSAKEGVGWLQKRL